MKHLPFLFRVCRKDPNCNRDQISEWHQGDAPLHGPDRFIVYIGPFVYVYYDSIWAEDGRIGERPLVLDIDIIEESHEFESETEALAFIKAWWIAN